jgi:hypothetical protein
MGLFEDASEAAGPSYAVAIRKIDGTVRRCNWEKAARRAFLRTANGRSQFFPAARAGDALPIGPGQPRTIPVTGLEIKNGKLISWRTESTSPSTPMNPATAFAVIWSIWTGKPVPITPEGYGRFGFTRRSIHSGPTTESSKCIHRWGRAATIPNLDPGFIPVAVVGRYFGDLWFRPSARFRRRFTRSTCHRGKRCSSRTCTRETDRSCLHRSGRCESRRFALRLQLLSGLLCALSNFGLH